MSKAIETGVGNAPEHAAQTRVLGSQAALLLAGSVFTLVVGLPLQIYVARTLGASGTGTFGLFEAAMMGAADVLSLGIGPALVRFIPEYAAQQRHDLLRQLIRIGLAATSAIGIAGFVLAALAGLALWSMLGLDASLKTDFVLMALLIPLSLLGSALQQALRGLMEIRHIVIGQSVLQLGLKAILTVALLSAGWDLTGYVIAVVAANVFAVGWLARGLIRRLNETPMSEAENRAGSWPEWKRYAGYIYVGNLFASLTGRLDRFVLAAAAGISAVGVAGTVTSLIAMPAMFLQLMISIAMPMFSGLAANDQRANLEHLYRVATDWTMRAAMPLVLFLIAFAEPILALYGPEFKSDGTWPLILLTACQLLNLGTGPAGWLLNATGHERAVFWLASLTSVASISALLVLAPHYGLMGWALAHAGATLTQNVAGIALLKRAHGISWWTPRYTKWLLPGIGSALLMTVMASIIASPGPLALAGCFALSYIAFAAASLAQGLNAEDMDLISHLRQRIIPETHT